MVALNPDSKPYRPQGAAYDLFLCREPEVLIEGPAGTGKSRAVLEKVHAAATKYPGARLLILRATRASMTQSVLVTFEEKVLPIGHGAKSGARRSHRESYLYPNGSEVVVGGLDNADRLMSTEYDMISVFEATEVHEDDFEKLSTRLRNGVMPYQQIIADCNPGAPTHWLNTRANAGKMVRLISRHTDNPSVTPEYLTRLSNLQGVRRSRLFEGRWVAAEGLVYDTFSRDVHVCRRDAPAKRVLVSVDDGYSDPFAALRIEIDADRRMHLAAMRYGSGMLFDAKRQAVADLIGTDTDVTVLYDAAAASLGAELRQHFPRVVACDKRLPIVEGVELVRERMRVQADGLPRFTVDQRCVEFLDEVDTYEWKKRRDGSTKDEPIDQHNHAQDALRYAVVHEDAGSTPYVGVVISGAASSGSSDAWGGDDRLWSRL